MKYITAAIIIILVLLSMTACSGITTNERDILDEVRDGITENTTVKELLDKIDTVIQEKHAETSGGETPEYTPDIPETPAVEEAKMEFNSFNSGEMILAQETETDYVFRIDYFKDSEPVEFFSRDEKLVWIRIVEGELSEITYKVPYDATLVYEKRVYVQGSGDLITITKSEINSISGTYNVFFTIVPDYFLGGYFGPESTAGLPFDSTIWFTIQK
jgi:hypothetical protein